MEEDGQRRPVVAHRHPDRQLQDIVREADGTARQAWLAIEDQFISNRETRALHLDATFRNFVQSNLNVNDYCRKMKGMADALRDLGKDIPNHTLDNVLRGMNKCFDHLKTFIKRIVPFPSFASVRNDLLFEEITMGAEASTDAATILYGCFTRRSAAVRIVIVHTCVVLDFRACRVVSPPWQLQWWFWLWPQLVQSPER